MIRETAKRTGIFIGALVICTALCFAIPADTASAASKPGKVKITSAKATSDTVTLKWKKARAS